MAVRKKAAIFAGLVLGLGLLTSWLVAHRSTYHALGRIQHAHQSEGYPATSAERVTYWFRKRAGLSVPSPFTHRDTYLPLGEARLTWSVRNARDRTGYFYTRVTAPQTSSKPVWKFSKCEVKKLSQVTVDTLREASWRSGVHEVEVGEIWLGKYEPHPDKIYVIRLVDETIINNRGWGRLEVEYIEVDSSKVDSGST